MLTKNVLKSLLAAVVLLLFTPPLLLNNGHSAPLSPTEEIIIGGVIDLSGPGSNLAIGSKRCMDLAIAEINAQGGIQVGNNVCKIRGVVEDDGYIADKALAASHKLVGQGIKFIINFGSTGPAVQTATEPAKALFFPIISIDKILINKPYTFRCYPTASVNLVLIMDYLKTSLPAGLKIYVVQPDDVTGREVREVWNRFAPAYGLKIVGGDLYPPNSLDFAPLVTRVLTYNPDILAVRSIKTGASVAKEVLDQGYKGKFIVHTDYPSTWIEDVGSDKLGNGRLIGPSPNLMKDVPEKIRSLSVRYYDTHKEQANVIYTLTYNYVYLITQAIVKAGTTTDTGKIKNILETQTFDLPWGKVKFGGEEIYGRPGDGFFPVFVSEYRHSEKATRLLASFTAIEAKDKYLRAREIK